MSGEVVNDNGGEKKKQQLFREQLIEEVFGDANEGKTVPMEKVTLLLWQARDDPRVVGFMTRFLTMYSGQRDVFDGIEFYLPQISHMVIHLEAEWDDAILERFALIVSQHSLHFALQLNWILQGAIEDYQPETRDGEPNPSFNVLYYTRCVKLLTKLERCVVYGRPRAVELQRLYEQGKISRREYELMELADRRFNAAQIMSEEEKVDSSAKLPFGGWLLYKRRTRDKWHRRKLWKKRFFMVSDQMLYCYDKEPAHKESISELKRAMPLEGASVKIVLGKYPHMFEVHNQYYLYKLRADSKEELDRWMKILRDESEHSSLFSHPYATPDDGENTVASAQSKEAQDKLLSDLTESEYSRYVFFKEERGFIRDICDVAEKLRFKERSERKVHAPGLMENIVVPPCAYIPMCNNSDSWKRVAKFLPKSTKVFNTKARCPTVMFYISETGIPEDPSIDVAEYLHHTFNPSSEDAGHANGNGDNGEVFHSAIQEPTLLNSDSRLKTSIVWSQRDDDEGPGQGIASPSRSSGGRFKSMLNRDKDWLNLPRDKLARFAKSPSRMSVMIKEKLANPSKNPVDPNKFPVRSVAIVESYSGADEFELIRDNEAIDRRCLDRAKMYVCGGEMWEEKEAKLKAEAESEGDLPYNFDIGAFIAKSNDDLRQEVFVMQMIHYYRSIFANEGLPIWLKTYRLLSISQSTGMIELLKDSTSIDGLKKSEGYPGTLKQYFIKVYGDEDSESFKAAQHNFTTSLVGYSLVSYLLGLKDRHNGNIMIDIRGHLIHIDFGFAMGMAPGHEFSFERAPFKFTREYLDVMGGPNSSCYAEFKRLFVAGFEVARANAQVALGLVEIMMFKSNYPCFSGPRYGDGVAVPRFKERLMLHVPDKKIKARALQLIETSYDHLGTYLYDQFQLKSNGIAP